MNIIPMDIKRFFILTAIDIKLVLRTTKIYAYIPPVAALTVFLGWRFGKQSIHFFLSGLIIIFSMIFSTQFTRINREMAAYSIFPFPIKELIAAKNLSSLFCVTGLTIFAFIISAIPLGIGWYSFVNASALILFLSLVMVSSGNMISAKLVNADISYNLLMLNIIQALMAIPAFAIYIFLEGRIGLFLTVIFCFVTAAVIYMVSFLKTSRMLTNIGEYLLELE